MRTRDLFAHLLVTFLCADRSAVMQLDSLGYQSTQAIQQTRKLFRVQDLQRRHLAPQMRVLLVSF